MARLTHVATYQRVVGASLERIWENALDWEHLPWLHRSSFTDIRVLDRGPDFWRARVKTASFVARSFVIELRTERAKLAYVTRTVDGAGAGTEIRTRLAVVDDRATRIDVEFHVAGAARLLGPVVGAAYKRLYARLWSEDEQMMQRRQAVLDATAAARERGIRASLPPIALGPERALRARLPLVVDTGIGAVRVLVLGAHAGRGGDLVAHRTTCPHLGGPLENAAVVDGMLACPWHGYRFDVRTGAPVGEHRCRLARAPRVDIDPETRDVTLVWDGNA